MSPLPAEGGQEFRPRQCCPFDKDPDDDIPFRGFEEDPGE